MLPGRTIAKKAARAAYDKLGFDIVAFDVRKFTGVCDYFLIVSGKNKTHLDALADGIREALKKSKVDVMGSDGSPVSGWMVLDAGTVIVHLFQEKQRDFYDLRRLWADAPEVDLGDLSEPLTKKKTATKPAGPAAKKAGAARAKTAKKAAKKAPGKAAAKAVKKKK